MFNTRKAVSLILFFCLAICSESALFAQNNEKSVIEHKFGSGLSFNYSPHSFKGWGTIKNSKMAFINGQFWHTTINFNNTSAQIGSELILTHWVRYPQDGIDGPRDQRIGFGLIPFHMIVPFSDKPITPFVSVSVGMIFFNDRLPAVDGATLNYKLSSGFGIELPAGSNRKIQLGYRLQHISNGNSSDENPGIDSHVFFANLVFAKW